MGGHGSGGMRGGGGERGFHAPKPLNAWGNVALSAVPDRSR
jgi:hypothetical protein